MGASAERRAARGDLYLFGGCLLLSLVALALPQKWAAGLSAGIRASILRPLVELQDRAAHDRLARVELQSIEAQRDSLARLAQDVGTVKLENANLRALLELRPRLTLSFQSVELLHQGGSTADRMVLLAVGTAEGVAQFDPVVTGTGLLGYVWDATPHASVVLTWLHPEFRAHAVTGDGSVMGMISPARVSADLSLLELRGVALRDTLALGTAVYTSSLGAVFPRGIPIGTIIGIENDSLSYERVYRVRPFVNPGTASHAMVLKAQAGTPFLPLPGERKP